MKDIGYRKIDKNPKHLNTSTEFNSKVVDPFILEVVEKKTWLERKQFQLGANPSLSLPSLDRQTQRNANVAFTIC